MNQAISDALAANTFAAAQPPTQPPLGNVTTGTTIEGNGGQNVINITGDVNLSNLNDLVFDGTAEDRFIVNIFGNLTLTGDAVVSGGGSVTADHILLNFVGSNPSSITVGPIDAVSGTILAPERTMELDGSVAGGILGGAGGNPGITLNGTMIFSPFVPIPEPAIAALMLLGVTAIAARRRRAPVRGR